MGLGEELLNSLCLCEEKREVINNMKGCVFLFNVILIKLFCFIIESKVALQGDEYLWKEIFKYIFSFFKNKMTELQNILNNLFDLF